MSLPARLARTATRWRYGIAAHRALTAAVYGDCEEGHRITCEAIERGGHTAARTLAGAWCAAILADVPRSERRSGLYRPNLTGAAREIPVRDVAPALAWAITLVAAHARRDWVLCRALVDTRMTEETEPYLAVLLHAAADAVIKREEDRW